MYNLPRWKNPDRRRKINLSHEDPEYCWYYDLDNDDFEKLVLRLKAGERLDEKDNDRYGKYIYTIIFIAMSNPKFAKKPREERNELFEQAVMELLKGITTYNPDKGKIYSYAYRICFTSFCHYYTDKIESAKRQETIIEHCKEELREYYDDRFTHKTPRR